MEEQQHIFTNKMLRTLLIPVIFEQVLNSLMGTVDTMMVSNVGSAALSAVSLVDSIMTALDGTMDIKSTLGRGTVVTLGLPIYKR